MSKHLDIDPEIGDLICAMVTANTGKNIHLIMIAFEDKGEGEKLGRPTFVSSLCPDDMMRALQIIGGQIAYVGAPTVRQ